MNRVELSGTVTRDPEFPTSRRGDDGRDPGLFTYFTLAVASTRWDHHGKRRVIEDNFFSIIASEDVAEVVTRIRQGSAVHVVGELTQQEVEKAGRKERKTKVRALVITILRTPTGAGDDEF